MSNMTTVNEKFPVVDITHRPKRMQNDNLKSAGVSEMTTSSETGRECVVPQSCTLERVISFYETHAEGEYKNLYLQTAKWLREFMTKNIPVDAGVDVDKAQELLNKVRGGK